MKSALPAPWRAPAEVFDALEGRWQLARTIDDKASMRGSAMFERRADGRLGYREEGRVRLADGQEFAAHREYVYERSEGGFTVLFAEDPLRHFHRIALAPEGDAFEGAATHLCAPDDYDSVYRFLADGSFTIAHTVRGPRKAYASVTRFTRGGA